MLVGRVGGRSLNINHLHGEGVMSHTVTLGEGEKGEGRGGGREGEGRGREGGGERDHNLFAK